MMQIAKAIPYYQILLISDDAHGRNIGAWFGDEVKITCVNDEKQCQDLLVNIYWDLIILDADFLPSTFQALFKSIPQQNQWSHFVIIGESPNKSLLTDYLSLYVVNLYYKPLNKNHFVSLARHLAKTSYQKRQQLQKIILAIGAHPDDIEIGCGGYLSLLAEQGHSINFLTLSQGEVGGEKALRKHESIIAATLMHARLFLSDCKDTAISAISKTIREIENVVNQVHPTHVFTHSIHDMHQDHRNTHLACIVGCRSVPNVLSYLSPSNTVDFKPALFIDITHHIKKKLYVIECYKSQYESRPYLAKSFTYATAKYWGRYSDYKLVEPFEVVKMRGGYSD